jgi:hypothetical protein
VRTRAGTRILEQACIQGRRMDVRDAQRQFFEK